MHLIPKKINVCIRLRPADEMNVWSSDGNTIYATHGDRMISYDGFKNVLCNVSNAEVYRTCVREEIRKFLKDENCTVLAYGQTGAGKTYTMLGGEEEGIIKLATREILKSRPVGISYLEVYNEKLFDLSSNNEVQMFSVGNRNLVSNLWIENVNRWEEVLLFIERCERNRRYGSTEFNDKSSRSHTIFQVSYSDNNKTRTLNMIDLAGSERASRSGDRRREGSFINKSLLALCTVVNNIGYGKYTGFRDSKLTRILQPSLDGCTNLVAICMLSPDENCVEESISTLKFAARLSNIELKTAESRSKNRSKEEICEYKQKVFDMSFNADDSVSQGSLKPSNKWKFEGTVGGLDAKFTLSHPKIPEPSMKLSDEAFCSADLEKKKSIAETLEFSKDKDPKSSSEPRMETSAMRPFKAFESAIISSLQRKAEMLEELNTMNENRISSLERMVKDLLCKNPSKRMNEIFVLEKYVFDLRKGMIGKR